MKKYLIRFTALCALVTMVVACNSGEKEEANARIPIENSTFALYLDVNQILQKSGIAPQLQLLASAVSSEFEDPKDAEFITSIIKNLDNSGIRFSEPLYAIGEIDMDEQSNQPNIAGQIYVMGEVCNVDKVDYLIDLLNRISGANIYVTKDGNTRYIQLGDEAYIAYNPSRIVLATSNSDAFESTKKLLTRNHYDLSIFGDRDVAAYVNIKGLLDLIKVSYPELYDMWASVGENIADNSAVTFGLSFKPGAITLDMQTYNLPEMGAMKEVSFDHLAQLPNSTVAVMDMGFDGPAIVETLKSVITNDLAAQCGLPINDFNAIKNIIFDGLSSISGDVTLAVTELDGTIDEVYDSYYDYYWDEWEYYSYTDVDMTGTQIALLADTRNEYIISNLAIAVGNMLEFKGHNHYRLDFGSGVVDIKQDDNLLHGICQVTMNDFRYFFEDPFYVDGKTLSNARWINDVKNSCAYVLLDIKAAKNSPFGESLMSYINSDIDYPANKIASDIINMSSHIYIAGTSDKVELTWKFTNTDVNALNQIVRLVLSYAVGSF